MQTRFPHGNRVFLVEFFGPVVEDFSQQNSIYLLVQGRLYIGIVLKSGSKISLAWSM